MFIRTEPGVYLNAETIDEIRIEDAGDGWEIVLAKTDGTDVMLGVYGTFDLANGHLRDWLIEQGLVR